MIIDLDRHVGVRQLSGLFAYMPLAWQRHFEREEWLGATGLVSSHVRMDEEFRYELPEEFQPNADSQRLVLLLPYQALAVAGWADTVAARAYVAAINECAVDKWASPLSQIAIAVSPHDPAWSAAEVRRYAGKPNVAAVALPMTATMLGSSHWNQVYEACVEARLPVVAHFSGVEGHYLGAPLLSGGVHRSAFARLALLPHVAESNIASLAFEGTFERFPGLQVLFSGFGFTWLPSLMWRMDREWRTFRHDVPWVREPPSRLATSNMWFTTWPLGEAADVGHWQDGFNNELRARVVFGSHEPHGGDEPAAVGETLGLDWATGILGNGAQYLGLSAALGA
jgi:predicted TIM-barrel fold metal-dependent hydrolase